MRLPQLARHAVEPRLGLLNCRGALQVLRHRPGAHVEQSEDREQHDVEHHRRDEQLDQGDAALFAAESVQAATQVHSSGASARSLEGLSVHRSLAGTSDDG